MIGLGEIPVKQDTSIVESRNKIRLLAEDLNFDSISSTRLATITSELIRKMIKTGYYSTINVELGLKNNVFGLFLRFTSKQISSAVSIKTLESIFDSVKTSQTEQGLECVEAFKSLPDPNFELTQGFVTEGREIIGRLTRDELHQNVTKRAKELNCLNEALILMAEVDPSLEEVFLRVVNLIPPGWQYPDIACARIIYDGGRFETDNFTETAWKQSADIITAGEKVGSVEVYYLEEKPQDYEGPFLKEERDLIDALAREMGKFVERKQAEDLLRESQEKMRSIFQTVPDIILNLDCESIITFINRAVPGSTVEEVIGTSIYNHIPPEYHQVYRNTLEEVMAKGEITELETSITPAGSDVTMWNLNRIGPVTKDGQIIGVTIASTDITERKRLEEELKSDTEMKSKFTSMVSHELRSPLGVIKEGINIVLEGLAGDINNEQKDLLDTAKRNTDRLGRLINNVLDFQKMESGKMGFDILENDINEVVLEVNKAMSLSAKEKGLDLAVDVDNSIPKIGLDRDKIIQVLTNLVSNAIKYTEKGNITISMKQEDNTVHVIVRDTGTGIKAEDMQKLFQAFERLDSGIGRKKGGTGLGLAISKEIILAHKGKIWAESEAGKGSSFHFILPIKERRSA